MELLDTLETKIEEMLSAMDALKQEKARLAEEVRRLEEDAQGSASLVEENNRLREELAREKTANEAVAARIEGLLTKLKAEA